MVAVDSEAVVVCDCELPAAADVSFDPTGGDLAATTVQDAVAEVAAREVPDFADRLSFVENEGTTVAGAQLLVGASCGGGLEDFMVIGGGCRSPGTNLRLIEGRISDNSFICKWQKPLDLSETATAQVTCLSTTP